MEKNLKFFSLNSKFIGVFVGVLLAGTFCAFVYVWANPPTSYYTPSQHIQDPGCAPGDTNCSVQIFDPEIVDPQTGDLICYDGTKWTNCHGVPSTPPSYSVSLSCSPTSGNYEIGSGVWKSAGDMSFSPTYSLTGTSAANITASGVSPSWTTVTLSSPFNNAVSASDVNYPSSAGSSLSFTIHATRNSSTVTSSCNYSFHNRVLYGTSSKNSGFTQSDLDALIKGPLQSGKSYTNGFTVDAGTNPGGKYIVYAYPARIGTSDPDADFCQMSGGFILACGGFQSAGTVSNYTNSSQFSEDYLVYTSVNAGLGVTTIGVK